MVEQRAENLVDKTVAQMADTKAAQMVVLSVDQMVENLVGWKVY